MKRLDCLHEADVLDAIASHRWPDRVADDLRAHVRSCEICADVLEVAAALEAEHDAAWAEAGMLPTSQVVWFRAQARARAEAARQAARPIAVMQALGFACAAAVMSGLIGIVALWVWTRTDWLTALPAAATLVPLDSMGLAVRGILLAIGLWLVLAPVAVYLVAADD
jgi:hypothetical protein